VKSSKEVSGRNPGGRIRERADGLMEFLSTLLSDGVIFPLTVHYELIPPEGKADQEKRNKDRTGGYSE
jgi:hypothetical protein